MKDWMRVERNFWQNRARIWENLPDVAVGEPFQRA